MIDNLKLEKYLKDYAEFGPMQDDDGYSMIEAFAEAAREYLATQRVTGDRKDALDYKTEMLGTGNLSRIKIEGGYLYTMWKLDNGQMNTVFVPNALTQSVPPGFKLVPIEPTEEMLCPDGDGFGYFDFHRRDDAESIYRKMVSLAPQPEERD